VAEPPLGPKGVVQPPRPGHPVIFFNYLNFKINILIRTVSFDLDKRLLKNFDGKKFIVISIDLESKFSEKKKKKKT
jgi:hypothetical protein